MGINTSGPERIEGQMQKAVPSRQKRLPVVQIVGPGSGGHGCAGDRQGHSFQVMFAVDWKEVVAPPSRMATVIVKLPVRV